MVRASKFAVHYRLDTRLENHADIVAAIDKILENHMLEPVRVTSWQHLMSRYYIVTDEGHKIAQAWALIGGDNPVFAGSM